MSLIPFIKSLVSKCLARYSKLVAVILLLNEVMSTYSRYAEKGLLVKQNLRKLEVNK